MAVKVIISAELFGLDTGHTQLPRATSHKHMCGFGLNLQPESLQQIALTTGSPSFEKGTGHQIDKICLNGRSF